MKLGILYVPGGNLLTFPSGVVLRYATNSLYTNKDVEDLIQFILKNSSLSQYAEWFELNNINFPMVKEDFEIVEV